MQRLNAEAGSYRELHQVADQNVSPIKREAINAGAGDVRHDGLVSGRKYRAGAAVEMKYHCAGQPVAQLDIEVEFGCAQLQVFLGGAVKIVCARGNPFDDPAKG